ncbi:MAG TPA: hypothetical protein HA348_04820 [Thermoplasmata archaeon]|mgnify:CR=1 FL=1|nr:hypothetical protein [Thermoplasmata archaeon]
MHLGFIPDASIDYVYYDPPYGSNIDYSGINLMWEAWLNDIVDTKEEVVENVDQGKTIEDYKNMLIRSFKEVHRVLKDECFFL